MYWHRYNWNATRYLCCCLQRDQSYVYCVYMCLCVKWMGMDQINLLNFAKSREHINDLVMIFKWKWISVFRSHIVPCTEFLSLSSAKCENLSKWQTFMQPTLYPYARTARSSVLDILDVYLPFLWRFYCRLPFFVSRLNFRNFSPTENSSLLRCSTIQLLFSTVPKCDESSSDFRLLFCCGKW